MPNELCYYQPGPLFVGVLSKRAWKVRLQDDFQEIKDFINAAGYT